jgi:hypothetical protein
MKFLLPSVVLISIWMTITSGLSLNKFDCSSIHDGRFFQYNSGRQLNLTIIRKDSIQKEINAQTGDTSNWKIQWTDNCTFTCQYLSGVKFESAQESEFYKQAILVFRIKTVEQEFYTYDAEIKYNSKSRTFSDTVWRQAR